MTIPDIKDSIHANDWLFCNLEDVEINYIVSTSLLKEQQDHSYLIVYEGPEDIYDATPVATKINDNIIYFKSAKDHPAETVMQGNYNLYYGRDYIKYIHATPVYDYEFDETNYRYIQDSSAAINYYSIGNNSETQALYGATINYNRLYHNVINKDSTEYYKLTFFNDGVDWVDGKTNKPLAKMVANFTGPRFHLVGSIGPDYGKFRYRILSRITASELIEEVITDWTEFDCYSTQQSSDYLFMDVEDLDYREYTLELETLYESNVLSSGNNILIKELRFLKNYNIVLGEEEINPNLSFTSIGGIR